MKYKSLNQKTINIKHIDALNLSLDMSKLPTDVGDSCLTSVKNMIYNDGRLLTRQGLFTAESGLLDVTMCNGAMDYKYFLTDTVADIEGEQRRLAYAKVLYDDRNHFIFVFGIGENQNVKSLGYMIFGRPDDATFYSPQNVVFYTGKEQNGGGIFALVSLKNLMNTYQSEYYIYEIGKDFANWNRSIADYVPTVYINGTGNGYGLLDWKFSSTPKMLEPINILNGSFYAYFSADGVSTAFRLPYTDIDNQEVVCRVYENAQNFVEWRINANSQTGSQTYNGMMITANIDRRSGTVYFTSGSNYYAFPVINAYRENNIRIFAKKRIENGFRNIASSKIVMGYKDKWLFAGGEEKNKIYYTNYDTPLYFPDISSGGIGIADEAIISVQGFSDRIITATSKGIYEINIKNSGDFNAVAILGDNGKIFKKPDTFYVSKLGSNTARNNTMTICGDKLLWFGRDNAVYSLSKNGSSIEKISDSIDPILRKIDKNADCYAAGTTENYILSYENEAVIIRLKDMSCFYWVFPKSIKILGIIGHLNKLSFLYQYDGYNECYIAGLCGEKDILIKGSGYNLQTVELPLESEFALKCFDFGTMGKKTVKKVDLRLETRGKSAVIVGDRKVYAEFDISNFGGRDILDSVASFITDLSGVKYVELGVKSEEGINFGGADIYFY